jgi:hypothetical protein
VTVDLTQGATGEIGVSIICMGPMPSLGSLRFWMFASPSEAGLMLSQDPEGEQDSIPLNVVMPSVDLISNPVRMQLTCSSEPGDVELSGSVEVEMITAGTTDVDGYAPFQAIGIRLDNWDQAEGVTIRLDDLTIGS